MKRITIALVAMLSVAVTVPVVFGAAGDVVVVSDLSLEGEIEGENIIFSLRFKADVKQKNARLPLVVGDVAYLDGKLPKNAELVREGDKYLLKFGSTGGVLGFGSGKQSIMFQFASRPIKDGDWRQTSFSIPVSSIRKLSVLCDRDDLEVRFPGALDVKRQKTKDGKTQVTAFLGISTKFEVGWKPEVKKLEADLVVACDANTIATASVGALRLDTIFTYRVIQGVLSKLSLELPDVNVIQVRGEEIQDWRIDRTDEEHPKLVVSLGRPQEDLYKLQIESEMVLPKFPCMFNLPVLAPENVIRTSGFLMVGTDSAIKLQVKKAAGLTQVDQASFPMTALTPAKGQGGGSGAKSKAKVTRAKPTRSTYAYQYANTPYTLELNADDIVTSFTVDDRLVLALEDNELVFSASVQIDVKDAPAREILIETDPDPAWTVTSVTGKDVSEADTDVRDEPFDPASADAKALADRQDKNGKRVIYVPFKQAVSGTVLIEIRMEKSLGLDVSAFDAPKFQVLKAKSERGYLVVAAEKGIRLKAGKFSGLREVHTGSAPMRVTGAQQAFRFKEPGWTVSMTIERTVPAIHSEVFHLVSLGEGVMYCSAAITYHIGGAPVQEFKVQVPAAIETVEFTGADIEGWTREGEICTVRLQTKIMGDYTLLATYDKQFAYKGADISVAGVETIRSESEVGYIAIASSASLKLDPQKLPASIIEIDRDEIPIAYSSPITDPIIGAYKYVRTPHTAVIRVEPYETQQLLGQIADYIKISTVLSKDGESVTAATYYIKNASRQYLVVLLPKGVDLWSIKYVDEDGNKEDVLSQESNEGVLIPVRRPRDPNTALRIELVYAESHGDLGFWRSGTWGVTFLAPVLPATHASFASWTVSVPEKFSIASADGNMMAGREMLLAGLPAVVGKAWRLCKAVLDGWDGYTIKQALTHDWGGRRSSEFTRAVNLSGKSPLVLSLQVVPAWVGGTGSARMMIGGVILGLLITIVFIPVKKRRLALVALGLTVLSFGISQSVAGRSVLAAILATVVGFVLLRFLFKVGLKLIWRGVRLVFKGICKGATGLLLPVKWLFGLCRRGLGGLGRLLTYAWVAFREARERAHARRLELRLATAGMDYGPPPFETEAPDEVPSAIPRSGTTPEKTEPKDAGKEEAESQKPGKEGYVSMKMLGVLLAAGLVAGAVIAKEAPKQAAKQSGKQAPKQALARVKPPSSIPVMDSILVTIDGPGTGRDAEQSAGVTTVLNFEADEPVSFVVVPGTSVLTEFELSSRNLEIASQKEGYILNVKRKGKYKVSLKYQAPVEEKDAKWMIGVMLLENMKNKVMLKLPEPGLDIRSESAVLFRTEEKTAATEAEAVFGQIPTATFVWRPRVRKTKLEVAVFFCEVNTFVALQSGVVELTNLIRYQIAQGEIKGLKIRVPQGMSVTAVRAPGLATWSYDPVQQLLDAILDKPVSGNFTLTVITQVACEGLPYSATIGALQVMEASRQRGAIAIAAPDTIQVRVDEVKGLNPMNIEDFSTAAVAASGKEAAGRKRVMTVRRAFRYHQVEEVSATVSTEQVLPEIRVTETGTLSIADERIVLATKLGLAIAKSGIFSVELGIPKDFDVETLTGKDVSHWDEIKEEAGPPVPVPPGAAEPAAGEGAGAQDGRGVVVYFTRQVTDSTEINLVVASTEKGIEERITVPRVTVKDARKHNGKLTISGERGVRLMVESHRGVDVKKASEEGIKQTGVLVFDILRPTWSIVLKTEVMAPLVKPEVLQWVDLAEGMLQCRAYIRYKIENAGIKTFRLSSPMPGITLSATGRNIARVHELDKEKGTWQVDLHNKVENLFGMTVSYQVPYDPAKLKVNILPLRTVDTESQRGYLVVTCGGRVQVEPTGALTGLKVEDPRNIPALFGAGDLSSAIRCYRTVRPDYVLTLSVVRHESASVLPASIDQAHMTSVLSTSGKLLTRIALQMTVGDLRFLKVDLPNPGDTLWTVLVNGSEVSTSRDGELYCIPLEEQEGGEITSVDMVYAGSSSSAWLAFQQKYEAPKFGLPLNDIEWKFYVPPRFRYYAFGGTMENIDVSDQDIKVFNAQQYREWNKEQREASLQKARQVLDVGEEMVKAGKQKRAKKAFQEALNYSQGQADLNEDARIQLRNLVKQQVKIGLVNRRDAVRFRRNIIDEQQLGQMRGFQDGDYTQDYAASVERRLTEKDNVALDVVADKIIDQQAAAAGVVKAIRAAMPEDGKLLNFYRALQIDPDGDLTVTFIAGSGRIARMLNALWPTLLIFLLFWVIIARSARPREARSAA